MRLERQLSNQFLTLGRVDLATQLQTLQTLLQLLIDIIQFVWLTKNLYCECYLKLTLQASKHMKQPHKSQHEIATKQTTEDHLFLCSPKHIAFQSNLQHDICSAFKGRHFDITNKFKTCFMLTANSIKFLFSISTLLTRHFILQSYNRNNISIAHDSFVKVYVYSHVLFISLTFSQSPSNGFPNNPFQSLGLNF